jgi:RNA ligase
MYFPLISHINDVKPYIEGKEEFRIFEKDWYDVVNYVVAHDETFDCPMRTECRGLIFDKSGKLISRPYHKFFNVNEKPHTRMEKIDLSEPHVILEKLDGSMIRPIPCDTGFRLATKAGVTDVAMNAEVFIADKPEYSRFIEYCLNNGFTPIFEWCSRKNRIVVDYPEDKLILTAIRLNYSGSYVRWKNVLKELEICGFSSIPVVKTISCDNNTDISKVVDQVRKWEDDEGVIIRFDNGHMVKIKADDYVLRHKCKESLCQEKNVLSIIIDDSVDDIVPLLEKSESDRERLFKFQEDFWKEISKFEDEITSMYVKGNDKFPDQKEFAVEYVQKQVPSKYAPFMFKMRNSGDGPFDITMNHIKKNLGTQSKVDSVRWIFGGLKWN